MADDIILLCEAEEAAALVPVLSRVAPDAGPGNHLSVVHTLEMLKDAVGASSTRKRLIAFCTPVIVPLEILQAVNWPAYNFHPGPPSYPGIFPSVFAIYNRAGKFGVTAHVMAENTDDGPIVGVDWMDMPDGIDRLSLDMQSHRMIHSLFARLAPEMVAGTEPLAHDDKIAWGPRTYTRKDFEALLDVPVQTSAEEFALRLRAVGEGPDHALTVTLHGRRFRLVTEAGGVVVKGGTRIG
ncbi:MAG: formyltransferase family protein [Rhodospirillales bacterium]|nr:formyltransferase family protein [Rhodospirillales bacterium]